MSTTFAGGSARTQKATCSKCKRTVYVVIVDGVRVETDPELISVIPFEVHPAKKIMARRSHGEMCMKYQSEAARIAMQANAKRAATAVVASSSPMRWIDLRSGEIVDVARVPLRKPLPGKREPGQ